jgi:hypothetical protein
MKRPRFSLACLVLALVATLNPQFGTCFAASTITDTNRYAYGANFGWVDWRGDTANGAVIGEYVCSGYLYGANVGWINLGGGTPTNGIRYQNLAGSDFGVNHDGLGNLRGYAYGANIGWINFEASGAPKVDLVTGKLGGYAYSANCGWLSLSNASAVVQAASIAAGADTDGDGLADAWERTFFGNLTTANATNDWDHDGMTDQQEYMADTNPRDPNDYLRITTFTRNGSYNFLRWTSRPTRFYRVEGRAAFSETSPWGTLFSYDWLGWDNVGFDSMNARYFYRIRAEKPLSP